MALLALPAMVLLAGCGSGGSSSAVTNTVVVKTVATPGAGTQPTSTPTSSTATRPTQSGTGGSRSTTPTSTGTGDTAAPVAPTPTGHVLREYSGAGNARLGTIVVHSPSVLVWSTQRVPIQVFTSTGFILLNSSSSTGSTRLSGGTYRGVRVASRARWSLQLRTGGP